jgi:glycosyltransferase involved in cell wall biosynthesis
MNRVKVTLIKSELFKQGGLEKYTWQIAYDFCALQIPVTILTSGSPVPPYSHPCLDIVSLPVRKRLSYLSVLNFDKACAEYLARHPTPIVFSLDRTRFQTHIRAGNGIHAAYLKQRSLEEGFAKKVSFQINPLHQCLLSLEKKAFEHPELRILFTNSEMVKAEVLDHYKTDPTKIRVVHNGVEWRAFQEPFNAWEEGKERILSTLGLDRSVFHLLFVGHNFHRKGLHKLLRALALMKKEPFHLSVVGKDKNLDDFQKQTALFGLQSKVSFFGEQMSTVPFYQMADALVIPSIYDPFANVTVEALAMGLFVISSKHNGGSEVLTPQNGALIPHLNDPSVFASLLTQTLQCRKNRERASSIRDSVQYLDFPAQLRKITEATVQSIL